MDIEAKANHKRSTIEELGLFKGILESNCLAKIDCNFLEFERSQ